MKISMIELFHVSIPLMKPYKLSKVYGTISDAQAIIVKIHTDEGIVGYGEADPMPPFTAESPAGVMSAIRDHLGPCLLGEDPGSIPLLGANMDALMHENYTAKGAIDMALYDILGKERNIPLYALLGGMYRSQIPLLWPLGSGSPEEDVEQIHEKVSEGYRTFMLKMGSLPIVEEVNRIKAIRDRFGSDIYVIVDVNQGWEVIEVLEFISSLKEYRIDFIEQPIARWNVKGLRRIRETSPFPLSADESLISVHDAVTLIQEQAVDIFSIKVSKNGGLSRAQKIAILAEASGIKCLMNSMLELGISQAAALHLGCSTPNLLDCGHCYMSTLRLVEDVTDFSDHIEEACARPPDGPGLGIRIDQKKIEKYGKGYIKIT
jgi:L-alanine-DL-glutamate epimerase-like enolase superfamily enzyme